MTETQEKRQEMPNSVGRGILVGVALLLQVGWIVGLALTLTQYYAVIQLIASLLSLLVVLRLCDKGINSAYKISWIIVILVFPVFGLCLYLMFGSNTLGAIRKRFAAADAALEGTLPADGETLPALCTENPGLGGQAYYLQNTARFPAYRDTDVVFYGDTNDGLAAQKKALRTAKQFIFMEYHAIEDSTAWWELEEILAERAKAGVDVRVFYDDVGSMGFVSKKFVKHLNNLGIQCRCFNPLVPILNVFMNNRDHRKITVVDGKVGFTGGYNLANEYFNLTHPYGQWKDTGVRLEGKAVRSLTVIFLQMWGATQKEPLDPTPFLPTIPYTAAEGATVIPYADSPLDGERVGENVYLNMIKNAKRYIYITTPYLIISDEMQRELTLAVRRGIDVRIVTPGIPDKAFIYKVTRSYYAQLAMRGVRIYEYTPGFLHAKQFVVDDEVAAVGTINLDFRSLYLHFENGCWFCNCSAVTEVRRDFEEIFSVSAEVSEEYANRRPTHLRVRQSILRLLSPLL